MRRYTFYLSVALLAFGIGSFVVFKFYLKPENVSLRVEETSGTNIFMKRLGDVRADIKERALETPIEIESPVKKKTAFTCGDKILSVVLSDLRKDKDFNENAEYYLNENKPSDCKDILFIEKSVDLNGDGVKEAVVRGKNSLLCGGTGNCPMWIYEKSGGEYKKLLYTGGEFLEVKQESANGYKNIFVKDHASCCSSYQTTYKFDRSKYKESKCLFVDYMRTAKRVVTTCAEENARIEKESRQNKGGSGN